MGASLRTATTVMAGEGRPSTSFSAAKATLAMEMDDPKIAALREQVTAAQQEFDMAVTFHETWKPTAYDKELHRRMGKSFASQTFLIIRTALQREMLLALMRLWDRNKQAVQMSCIKEKPLQEGGDGCLSFRSRYPPRFA